MQQYIPPSIGADPELFVVDGKGKFISVHDFLPGTKAEPSWVDKGAIQADGTAAEFNINPANTAEEFTENIQQVLIQLQNIIRAHNPEFQLRVVPTATFDRRYFKKLPIEATRFGCDPDQNAWLSGVIDPPMTKEPFRTGGGHVHIGWSQGTQYQTNDAAHVYDCMEATKQLDAVLYLSSLLWDDDDKRRTLYGKVGSFRPKPYGVEYRPLSNAWVSDPDLHIWIFNATRWAMRMLDQDDIHLARDAECYTLLQAIKKGDKPSRSTIRDHHMWLTEDLSGSDDIHCPRLPDSYLAA